MNPGTRLAIRGVSGREHPAVEDRQTLVLHLAPLPADAFPEAPVVIVIAGPAGERQSARRHAYDAVERAGHHRDDVAGDPAAGAGDGSGGSERPRRAVSTTRLARAPRQPPHHGANRTRPIPVPIEANTVRTYRDLRRGVEHVVRVDLRRLAVSLELARPVQLQPDAGHSSSVLADRPDEERQVEARRTCLAVEVEPLHPRRGSRGRRRGRRGSDRASGAHPPAMARSTRHRLAHQTTRSRRRFPDPRARARGSVSRPAPAAA